MDARTEARVRRELATLVLDAVHSTGTYRRNLNISANEITDVVMDALVARGVVLLDPVPPTR